MKEAGRRKTVMPKMSMEKLERLLRDGVALSKSREHKTLADELLVSEEKTKR